MSVALIDWLESPITDRLSPHLGHPRWHLVCPPYHAYRFRARHNSSTKLQQSSQRSWAEWRFKALSVAALDARYKPDGLEGYYYDKILDALRPFLSQPLVDVGCGDGMFLRHVIQQTHIPVQSVFACEYHNERRANAVRQAYLAAVNRHIKAGGAADMPDVGWLSHLSDSIIRHNVLESIASWPQPLCALERPVVTMLAFSPCFDEAEMNQVALTISKLRPSAIFDFCGIENASDNVGGPARASMARFFEPHGFQERDVLWIPEPLRINCLRFIATPRRFWGSARLSILIANH